jgi:phosphodiesterase/alkaline phosphatase D-like protein
LAATAASFGAFAGAVAAASSPSVSTGGATHKTQTSAVLNGTVNPNGSATSYYFQWGLTNSYGANDAPHSAGSATTSVAVHRTIGGLIPGTTYHYRLVATTRYGTTVGRDRRFTTAGHPPPGAITGFATGVGTTFATLTGVVNPHGETTAWSFEYGPGPSYGSFTGSGTVAATSKSTTVAYSIRGLAPGTIFHYRLIARHGSIVSFGGDQIFMTHPTKRPVPVVRARTRPHHARGKPFVFTTFGRILHPASIPRLFACSGEVAIRFFVNRRPVTFILVPVLPNCTFSGQTLVRHRPRRTNGHLRVVVRYRGNGYLRPARARPRQVVVG